MPPLGVQTFETLWLPCKKECPENIIEIVRVYTEIVRKLSENCSFHDNSWDSKFFECLKISGKHTK